MLQKNLRTIDEYKRAGAEMRLFKTLGSKLAVDISGVLSAQDSDMKGSWKSFWTRCDKGVKRFVLDSIYL